MLSIEQAEFVKYLRVNQECTFRGVALEYANKYLGGYSAKKLQEFGIWLCDESRKQLNEEISDGWEWYG